MLLKYGLILWVLASSSWAASTTLDLSKTIELTLQNSSELKEKQEVIREAKADMNKATSSRLPNADISIKYQSYINPSDTTSFDLSTGSLQVVTVPIKKDYGLESSLTITQTLWTFGKIQSAINASRQGLDLAQIGAQDLSNDLKYLAKKGFLGSVLSQKVKKIQEESLLNAQENNRLYTRRFQRGRAVQSNLLRLKRDIESRKPQVDKSEEDLQKSISYLQMLTGTPYHQKITIEQSWPKMNSIPSLEEARKRLLTQSTKLQLGRSNIKLNEDQIAVKKSALYPNLALFASMSAFGEDNEADFSSNQSIKQTSTIGLSISIPLYAGGSRYADIGKARAQLGQARYQLEHNQKQLELQLESLYIQKKSFEKQKKSNQKFLDLAKRTFKMSQNRIDSGQASIIELNDAEQLLTQAKLQLEMSIYNEHLTVAEIHKFLNTK